MEVVSAACVAYRGKKRSNCMAVICNQQTRKTHWPMGHRNTEWIDQGTGVHGQTSLGRCSFVDSTWENEIRESCARETESQSSRQDSRRMDACRQFSRARHTRDSNHLPGLTDFLGSCDCTNQFQLFPTVAVVPIHQHNIIS